MKSPARGRNVMAMRTCLFAILVALAAPVAAHAQSADLVLRDRVAADRSDPDKPADVKGVPEIAGSDVATAIKFCKQAAASSRRAMFALGRAYAANRQTSEAIAAWRKAADKGSSAAMVELGVAYGTGAGIARDEAQARTLLGKAAETNAEAQYQLGLMLASGNGGEKDDVAARALFEKAAAQNHPGALERMGAFAQEGRGGPKDKDAAKAYYERAAALGDEDAKKALERLRCPYAIKDKQGKLVTTLCF